MQRLRTLALSTKTVTRQTASGIVNIENLTIHFPPAIPRYLLDPSLSKTYRTKPLVDVNGESLFGELAILRYLQMDGWDGVWVDTYHGGGTRKLFWSSLPPGGFGRLSSNAETLYDEIVLANGGKSSGFFDVFAWNENRFIFVEYKGKSDRSNKNELQWINAAIKCGVQPEDLFFVSY